MRGIFRNEAIVDIQFGEGGNDAKLFAQQIAQMYRKWGRAHDLEITTLDESSSKTTLHVKGKKTWEAFGNEPGKHVVQRQSKGKLHTSTVAVSVLPMSMPDQFELNWKEVRIDFTCGSGKGGQHRNRKKTAVRVVHVPTNTIVFICNERDQEQNKALALEILEARLKASRVAEREEEQSKRRQEQMGGGKRSDKRRTYNFIDGFVQDHVLGLRTQDIAKVMKGKLEKLLG